VRGDVAKGTYVHPYKVTLAEACENWLAAKHGLKPSTLHGHRVNLAAALAELGEVEVQKLTKRNIDDLVTALRAGGLPSPTGKSRKPWSPRSDELHARPTDSRAQGSNAAGPRGA
jgi:hypothetical protein